MNKAWTLIDKKTGQPVIKNGIAERLSFKKVDENNYTPTVAGEIVFNSNDNMMIAVMN